MTNNSKFIQKIAFIFMKVGSTHINTLSIGPGFYEPKISPLLLDSKIK